MDRAGWSDQLARITIILLSRSPLNPVENIWQYLRIGSLTASSKRRHHPVAKWNKLIDQPETMSIGMRDWAISGQY